VHSCLRRIFILSIVNSLPKLQLQRQLPTSFKPTTTDIRAKLFKEKFGFWRWQKNLSGNVAHWMIDRADLREASGRKTVTVQKPVN